MDKLDYSPPDHAALNVPAALAGLEGRAGTWDHFRRNHFSPPAVSSSARVIALGGAVSEPRMLPVGDLRTFEHRSLSVVLECAGHRRAEMLPPAPGLQWGIGAVSEAVWTGVSLADVLRRSGLAADVTEIVLRGADGPGGRRGGSRSYARSLPLAKALHPDTLLAFEMNGEPIPPAYGGPVRAIVPGWYAMDSVKWLASIRAATRPFAGPFQAMDYRWREPDEHGPGRRIDQLSVHALITSPATGGRLPAGVAAIRGIAWAGETRVARVEVQVDDTPWEGVAIRRRGRYARAFWHHHAELDSGTHHIAVRATDGYGAIQPTQPVANAGGYCSNAVHRIAVTVGKD